MLLALMIITECSYAYTGNELEKKMVEYEKLDNDITINFTASGNYSGYVTGVADATNGLFWCNPGNITYNQEFKVVSKYLNNNPEKLHLKAVDLVVQALTEAFPCKK